MIKLNSYRRDQLINLLGGFSLQAENSMNVNIQGDGCPGMIQSHRDDTFDVDDQSCSISRVQHNVSSNYARNQPFAVEWELCNASLEYSATQKRWVGNHGWSVRPESSYNPGLDFHSSDILPILIVQT